MMEAPPPFCAQLSASEVASPCPRACPGQERGADASPLDTVNELEFYPIPCVTSLAPKTEQA